MRGLDELARSRGQTLAQMALAWVLRHPAMTAVLVGASRVDQVEANIGALANLAFAEEELEQIEDLLAN